MSVDSLVSLFFSDETMADIHVVNPGRLTTCISSIINGGSAVPCSTQLNSTGHVTLTAKRDQKWKKSKSVGVHGSVVPCVAISDGRNQIAIRFNRDLNRNEDSIQILRDSFQEACDLILIRFKF